MNINKHVLQNPRDIIGKIPHDSIHSCMWDSIDSAARESVDTSIYVFIQNVHRPMLMAVRDLLVQYDFDAL